MYACVCARARVCVCSVCMYVWRGVTGAPTPHSLRRTFSSARRASIVILYRRALSSRLAFSPSHPRLDRHTQLPLSPADTPASTASPMARATLSNRAAKRSHASSRADSGAKTTRKHTRDSGNGGQDVRPRVFSSGPSPGGAEKTLE
jgi:hypothetical protein